MRCPDCFLGFPDQKEGECAFCGVALVATAADLLGGNLSIVKEKREPQIQMAELVENAISAKKNAIAEAGVGTGKSLAYLIPAILSGKRTVVSTATIGLQTQLVEKDLPFLAQALGRDLNFALAKGKGNYLCAVAAQAAIDNHRQPAKFSKDFTSWVDDSLRGKTSADKAELGDKVPSEWHRVTAEICIGRACIIHNLCGYIRARTKMQSAKIVVANHSIVALDAFYSTEKKLNPLFGPYQVLVLDEAHKAAEYIRSAFTLRTSNAAPHWAAQALDRQQLKYDPNVYRRLNQAAQTLANLLPAPRHDGVTPVLPIHLNERYVKELDAVKELVGEFTIPLRSKISMTEGKLGIGAITSSEERFDYYACKKAVRTLTDFIDTAKAPVPNGEQYQDNLVAYMQFERGEKVLTVSPVSVAPYLKAKLYPGLHTVIATSATLSIAGNFHSIKDELGIYPDPQYELKVKSPFKYEDRSVLYIATHIPPAPKMQDTEAVVEYAKALAQEIKALTITTSGRAFVLFTSKVELEATFAQLGLLSGLNLLKQDDRTTASALLEKYREEAAANRRPVLLGLKSFWEGVSVEGDDLSCVIVTKLPFPSVSDPIYKALCDRAGTEAFQRVTLPAMIRDVQQGTGRLIRTANDIGIVAILDSRVATQRYGNTVISSLPFPLRSTSLPKVKAKYQEIVKKMRT